MKIRNGLIFLIAVISIVGGSIIFYITQNTPIFTSATTFETKEIPLYDRLQLTASENVAILAATENKLLITTYLTYSPQDSHYREIGFNSYSKRLFVYNWKSREVTAELDLSPNELYTDGILLNGEIICASLTPTETGSYCAKIVHITSDSTATTVFECITSNTSYYTPQLVPLDDGGYLFTYYDTEKSIFGIQSVTKGGTLTPIYTSAHIEDFIGTEISSNGSQFLYYTIMEGTPSFLIGDQVSILSSFALDKTQSMHSFAITKECVFATLQNRSNQNITDEACLFKFDGTLLLRQSYGPYFCLTFNKSNGLFATDMKYNAYSISFIKNDKNGDIIINREIIDLFNESMLFYPIDQNTCLISSGDLRPKLIEVTHM